MGCAWSSCSAGLESSTTLGRCRERRGLRPIGSPLERRDLGPLRWERRDPLRRPAPELAAAVVAVGDRGEAGVVTVEVSG